MSTPNIGRLKIGADFMVIGTPEKYLRIGPVISKQPGFSFHSGSHYSSVTDTTEPDFNNPLVGYDLPVLLFTAAAGATVATPSGDLTWTIITSVTGTAGAELTMAAWVATVPAAMGAGNINVELDRTCDWVETSLDHCDAADPIVQSNTAHASSGTTVTVSQSGLTAPDLSVVACFVTTGGGLHNLTNPAGWTLLNIASNFLLYYGLPVTASPTSTGTVDNLCAIIVEPESI